MVTCRRAPGDDHRGQLARETITLQKIAPRRLQLARSRRLRRRWRAADADGAAALPAIAAGRAAPEDPGGGWQRTAAWISGGAAVLFAGAAVVGLVARGHYADRVDGALRDGGCVQRGDQFTGDRARDCAVAATDRDQAATLALVSGGAAGVLALARRSFSSLLLEPTRKRARQPAGSRRDRGSRARRWAAARFFNVVGGFDGALSPEQRADRARALRRIDCEISERALEARPRLCCPLARKSPCAFRPGPSCCWQLESLGCRVRQRGQPPGTGGMSGADAGSGGSGTGGSGPGGSGGTTGAGGSASGGMTGSTGGAGGAQTDAGPTARRMGRGWLPAARSRPSACWRRLAVQRFASLTSALVPRSRAVGTSASAVACYRHEVEPDSVTANLGQTNENEQELEKRHLIWGGALLLLVCVPVAYLAGRARAARFRLRRR